MQTASLHDLNRKVHIHLGLLLVLFVWLFSFTGLLLNHNWKFAGFWEEREETPVDFEMPAEVLMTRDAAEFAQFLKLTGEVALSDSEDNMLKFRVESPGIVRDLEVDLLTGKGHGRMLRFNVWGKLRTLHTFNGTTYGDQTISANWLATKIWRASMDALAIGLIVICISSWIMWYKVRHAYKLGYAILVAALMLSGYFLFWN